MSVRLEGVVKRHGATTVLHGVQLWVALPDSARHTDRAGPGTVYTFAVGGTAKPPAFVEYKLNALLQGVPYDKTQYDAGTALFFRATAFYAKFHKLLLIREISVFEGLSSHFFGFVKA